MIDNLTKLKEILSEKFGVPDNQITDTAMLRSDLNLSDLEITDFISLCATVFHLKLTDDINLENIKLVGDILILIEETSEDL